MLGPLHTHGRPRWSCRLLTLIWLSLGHGSHLGNEAAGGRLLSLSLSPRGWPLCVFLIKNISQGNAVLNCSCGAKGIFGFQVVAQLLNFLKADKFGRCTDRSTLAVFTCAEHQGLGTADTREFTWKEDLTVTGQWQTIQP